MVFFLQIYKYVHTERIKLNDVLFIISFINSEKPKYSKVNFELLKSIIGIRKIYLENFIFFLQSKGLFVFKL